MTERVIASELGSALYATDGTSEARIARAKAVKEAWRTVILILTFGIAFWSMAAGFFYLEPSLWYRGEGLLLMAAVVMISIFPLGFGALLDGPYRIYRHSPNLRVFEGGLTMESNRTRAFLNREVILVKSKAIERISRYKDGYWKGAYQVVFKVGSKEGKPWLMLIPDFGVHRPADFEKALQISGVWSEGLPVEFANGRAIHPSIDGPERGQPLARYVILV